MKKKKIESLNTEIENLSKQSSVELNSRMERTDERNRNPENMTIEIAQSERQRKNKLEKK